MSFQPEVNQYKSVVPFLLTVVFLLTSARLLCFLLYVSALLSCFSLYNRFTIAIEYLKTVMDHLNSAFLSLSFGHVFCIFSSIYFTATMMILAIA